MAVNHPSKNGLMNVGESCFINSVLQLLSRIPQFRAALNNHLLSCGVAAENCLGCVLRDTFEHLDGRKIRGGVRPSKLIEWLAVNASHFNPYQQGDANEFLMYLIDKVPISVFQSSSVTKNDCPNNCEDTASEERHDDFFMATLSGEGPFNVSRSLLANANESAHLCPSCGVQGLKGVIEIIAPPEVIAINIGRYGMDGKKIETECIVDDEVSLETVDGISYKYKVLGTIDLYGQTSKAGHYVFNMKERHRWVKYSDNVITTSVLDAINCLMVFYLKQDPVDHDQDGHSGDEKQDESVSDIETENSITNPDSDFDYELDSSNTDLSSQNEDSDGYEPPVECAEPQHSSSDEDDDEILWTEDMDKFVDQCVTQAKLMWIRKQRLLVICLPKRISGNTFLERFQKCRNEVGVILYTYSFRQSSFFKKLLCDPIIRESYDVYTKEIYSKYGCDNIYQWLAVAAVYCILDTNLCNSKRKMEIEFIFDQRPNCILSKSILNCWEKVVVEVTKYLPMLGKTEMFCIKSCTRACIKKPPGHCCLIDMEKCPDIDDDELDEFSHLNSWRFRDNYENAFGLPFQPLLNPCLRELNSATTLLLAEQVLHMTNPCRYRPEKNNVYIIMVVNGEKQQPKAEELVTLWNDGVTEFHLYAGLTATGPYRKGHFEGQWTSVSQALTDNSTVFLLSSQPYENPCDAAAMEAAYILIIMWEQMHLKKLGQSLTSKVLNKKNEYAAIIEGGQEIADNVTAFIKSRTPLFTFIDDGNESSTKRVGRIEGNFLVKETIDREVFG